MHPVDFAQRANEGLPNERPLESGCWTLSKQQEDSFSLWNARLLSQMRFHRNRANSVADLWKNMHHRGHELANVYVVEPVAM